MMFGIGLAGPQIAAAGSPSPPNLVPDSWQFSAAAWGGAAANWTVTAGQLDPFGGTKATAFTATGAPSAFATEVSSSFVLSVASPVCLSAYYKATAFPPPNGLLRIYDHTALTSHNQAYNIAGDQTITLGAGANVDGASIVDVGSGWYRIALVVDLVARGAVGHTFTVRLELFGASPTAGHTFYVAGVMLNAGASPAAYQERP